MKLNQNLFLITLFGFITISIGVAWAGPQMNPGKWEITTRTEMAGMPPQSITHVQCITADDLVPMSRDANQECQVTDIVYSGNTISWKISCSGQGGGMEGTGSATYSGDSMDGIMNMTITGSGNIQIKNIMAGRRIGECDGSAAGTSLNSSAPANNTEDTAGNVVADDMIDVGKAAKDEAKQSTIEEVNKGVKDLIKGLFN
ncbi:MAG: DUF3617 domain-containing protein [Desulfobacterales bacterium]|nr:DUF3617 domain-containing protein [Desulfobacterales bacterium]